MAKTSGGGSRIVFGGILVLLGFLLLLSQMDIIDFGDVVAQFWPLIIITVGLWQWARRRFRASVGPLILVFVGLIIQLAIWDVFSGEFFGVMIGLVLVLGGLWLILRKGRPERPPAVTAADRVDQWIAFGGIEETITSQAFEGGEVTTVFGGAELDLRQAALAPGGCLLEVTAIFGGVELRVPAGCRVVVDGSAILGGIDDKSGSGELAESAPTLKIEALAIFGGIEIIR
ncbi:MAG: LiaF domain-containing protein [Candidatus Zixiibacteriota bacterium]